MEKVLQYIDKNKDRFLEELKDFLRIPSISNNAENKKDVLRCAHYVADQLRQIGMQQTQLFPTPDTPSSTENGWALPVSRRSFAMDITTCNPSIRLTCGSRDRSIRRSVTEKSLPAVPWTIRAKC